MIIDFFFLFIIIAIIVITIIAFCTFEIIKCVSFKFLSIVKIFGKK